MSELPRGLKVATVWLLLGLALFLGVQTLLSQQQRTRLQISGAEVTIRRGSDGHYHWPGTVNGQIRLTEQGEIIASKFSNAEIGRRNLELLVAATLEASLAPQEANPARTSQLARFEGVMAQLSDLA